MFAVPKKLTSTAVGILLTLFISAGIGQNQIDQKIRYQYCVASPDSTCFNPANGAVDSVGSDVAELGGDFIFCLQVDTVDSGIAPVRVVLVLDKSTSMCTNPTTCCQAGDSSMNCATNDPDDMRIQAANTFVDSLAAKSPESEIGVVAYDQNATVNNPIPLSPGNLATIKRWINQASNASNPKCNSTPPPAAPAPTPAAGLTKTTATKVTNLGRGMDAGLKAVDYNYDRIPAGMTRHIIQLTDGAWDDTMAATITPDVIVNNYKANYPDRAVPKIHGVFLSNTQLHLAHGYPAEGCSEANPVVLTKLEAATKLTGGIYFPGSTPQTVIANFVTLLGTIARTANQVLASLEVTNSTNNTSSVSSTIKQVGQTPTWEASLKSLPLAFGPNALAIKRIIKRVNKPDSTVTTNVTIIRSTGFRKELDKDLFKLHCDLVDANMRITATPAEQTINTPVAVNATISNASSLNISNVAVRLLTKFPDAESGVIATFHLDGNVTNATNPSSSAIGTPQYTTTTPLFGSGSMTGGSFDYTVAALAGDFILEEWVKPSAGAGKLFDGGGVEFGIDASGNLYLKDATTTAMATIPLDAGAWSQVAVARQNGQVIFFVNGTAVSEPIAFATAISAGKISFYAPNKWIVDEIRISNTSSRIGTEGNGRVLALPVLANPKWVLKEVPTEGASLTVPSSAWGTLASKALDFTFTSPVSGTVVVNIRQQQVGTAVGTGWSKNSNPVKLISDTEGPYVTKGTLSATDDENIFSLEIEFSEPVRCDSLTKDTKVASSFEFYTKKQLLPSIAQGSKYVVTSCPSEFISTIKLLVPTGLYPGTDSVRLIGKTTDAAGNPPDKDKKGVIGGSGSGLKINGIANNHDLSINEDVKKTLGITQSFGKVVVLKPTFPLMKVDSTISNPDSVFYGEATVYDAVGNLIASKLKIYQSKVDKKYYYTLWNGTNRNGRRIGPGGYYIHFTYKYAGTGQAGNDGKKFLIK